jgi:hypothetical protein
VFSRGVASASNSWHVSYLRVFNGARERPRGMPKVYSIVGREGLSRDADACCVSCSRGKVMSLGSVQPRGFGVILVAKVRHLDVSFCFLLNL